MFFLLRQTAFYLSVDRIQIIRMFLWGFRIEEIIQKGKNGFGHSTKESK